MLSDSSDFINVPFSRSNLDRYLVRRSIFNAVNENLSNFKGKLLDAGCGKMPYRQYILASSKVTEYIGLDIESALVYDAGVKPDFTWDGKVMPFENASFTTCIATEVLEHCPEPEVFLKEVNRVLKPNGIFFFTVPFLWNLHEVPHDEYRYTPFSLQRHLTNSGFTDIQIKATGGWHLAMAQMIGLWVKRAPIAKRKRKLLTYIALPVVRYLIKIGSREKINFKEGQMITGFYGTAIK